MAKGYRVTTFVRVSNWMVERLLRAGLPMGTKAFPMVLLTVKGRKSGQPRTTPVVMFERNGERLLLGTFGEVNWVQNLRSAGEAVITRRRQSERVSATVLPAEEAGPILKEALTAAAASRMTAGTTVPYFDVAPGAPVEDFVREAPRHPVFRITRARGGASATDGAGASLAS